MNLYLDLFATFAKVGVCTFGGGYAMLPILQRELVEKRNWATEEELSDYFAIGQCTPGIIAVNTATFVGHKLRGAAGGVAATLSLVVVLLLAVAGNFASFPANALGSVLNFICSPIVLVVAAGVTGLCVRAAKGGGKA